MFGGLAFMVGGHMCCGVIGDDLMVRVGRDAYEDALAAKGARPMDFTGRPLRGMVYVGSDNAGRPGRVRGRARRKGSPADGFHRASAPRNGLRRVRGSPNGRRSRELGQTGHGLRGVSAAEVGFGPFHFPTTPPYLPCWRALLFPPTRPVRPAAMKTGRGDLKKATPAEIQGHPKPRKGGSAPFGTPGLGLPRALCAPTFREVGPVEPHAGWPSVGL